MPSKKQSGQNAKEGLCAFCTTPKKLCESHILPKWLLRDRDVGKSGYFQYSSDDPFKRRIPEGWKEYMLCRDCEDIMQVYDDYSANFFRGSGNWRLEEPHGFRVWIVTEYDYSKLKLFFMSVLWRAAVAKDKAFEEVHLEQTQLDRLHQMLDKADAGSRNDFTVILHKREPLAGGIEKIAEAPRRSNIRDSQVLHYTFDLNEYFFQIKASAEPYSKCESFWLPEEPPFLILEGRTVPQRIKRLSDAVLEQQQAYDEFKQKHPKPQKPND